MAQYLIPATLDLTIFVGDTFRNRCLNIVNFLALRRTSGDGRYGYVNIHSRDLKHLTGGNYRIYVNFLISKRVIERNNSHCSNEMARHGAFSKSYRFSLPYAARFKVVEVAGEHVKPASDDRTDTKDTVCALVAKNCCRLTLDHVALATQPFQLKSEALALIANLQLGSANAKRGKRVKRIFHRVNGAAREVRKLLRFNGSPLVEYDMKSAHPVLVLSLYSDPRCAEAVAYKEVLKRDIYSVFGVSRDDAKDSLRQFFYAKRHAIRKDGSSGNPIANFFRFHFPILFAAIVSATDLSVRLQDLESYFFNDFIAPKAHDLGLFYISIHDGFMCESNDAAETIRYLIVAEFGRMFQYAPEIVAKFDGFCESRLLISE